MAEANPVLPASAGLNVAPAGGGASGRTIAVAATHEIARASAARGHAMRCWRGPRQFCASQSNSVSQKRTFWSRPAITWATSGHSRPRAWGIACSITRVVRTLVT